MRLFDNLYRSIDNVTVWSADFFNRIFRSLDDRLHKLEERDLTLDGIVGSIVADAQKTVQNVIDPAVVSIRQMQERGFLLANSGTERLLAEGAVLTWTIDEGDDRVMFTPSVFTILSRAANSEDFAVLRTVDYNRETGLYTAEVTTFEGDPGPHDDWIISAVAGPTIAQQSLLADGRAARDEVIAARPEMLEARDVAVTARDFAAARADAAAGSAAAAQAYAEAAATFDPAAKANTDLSNVDSTARLAVGSYSLLSAEAAAELDFAAAQVFRIAVSADIAIAFANEPAADRALTAVVHLSDAALDTRTITWPGGITWSGGSAPTLEGTEMVIVLFWTGAKWIGTVGPKA